MNLWFRIAGVFTFLSVVLPILLSSESIASESQIETNSTEFTFHAEVGYGTPPDQILFIRNAGTDVMEWEILEESPWLSVSPFEGSSSGEWNSANLHADIEGLATGVYTCSLTIKSPSASTQTVSIILYLEGPSIAFSPQKIEAVADYSGHNPTDQSFGIWNGGTGSLAWKITESCDWLDVAPSEGISTGEVDTISLIFNTHGLTFGTHQADLVIEAPYAGNSPTILTVYLTVKDETKLYVAQGASGDGSSWLNPMGSLDTALAMAVPGDTIFITEGVYVPEGDSLEVPDGVILKGGYTNAHLSFGCQTLPGQFYNPETYVTVLSGDKNSNDSGGILYGNPDALDNQPRRLDNASHLLTLMGSATLDGLLFAQGGKNTLGAGDGGGVYASAGTVTIINCKFMGCIADRGAAIYFGSADGVLSQTYFFGNSGGHSVVHTYKNLAVDNCTFKGNSNTGGYTHGIYVASGGSSFTMSNCMVVDSVSGPYSAYGSLFIRSGTANLHVSISKCAFKNDQADASSAFFSNEGYSPQTWNITNCYWSACKGRTGNGTLLFRPRYPNSGTVLNIQNITIANCNDPGVSAGIKVCSGGASLNNSDFVCNLKNSIVWGNSGAQVYWDTATMIFTDTSYNPFKISYCCIDTVDPNNYPAIGNSMPTGLRCDNPQILDEDCRLAPTSPCIDKGDPASAYSNEPKWLNGCRINMGAHGNTKQAQVTASCAALSADVTGDCKTNTADLLTLRAQWLKRCP